MYYYPSLQFVASVGASSSKLAQQIIATASGSARSRSYFVFGGYGFLGETVCTWNSKCCECLWELRKPEPLGIFGCFKGLMRRQFLAFVRDEEPVVRCPIPMTIIARRFRNHLSRIGYFCLSAFEGTCKLVFRLYNHVAKAVGKAEKSVPVHNSEAAFDRIIRSVIEVEHVEEHLPFIVDAPDFSVLIAHEAYPDDSIRVAE